MADSVTPQAMQQSADSGNSSDGSSSWEVQHQQLYLSSMQWLHLVSQASVCLGLGTNLFNFCVFWCEPVRRHCLTACLRLLAANDFLLLLLFLVLTQTGVHHTGWLACFLTNYAYGTASALSAWLLVAITLDRVLFLRSPAAPASATRASRMARTAVAGALVWNLHWAWSVGYGGHFGRDPPGGGGGNATREADAAAAAAGQAMLCVATAGRGGQAIQLIDSLLASFLPGLALLALNAHIVRQLRRLSRSLATGANSRCYRSSHRGRRQGDDATADAVADPGAGDDEALELEPQGACRTVSWSTSEQRQHGQNHDGQSDDHQNQQQQQQQQCQASRMLVGFCLAYLGFNLPNYVCLAFGLLLFASLDGGSSRIYAAYNLARSAAQLLYLLHFTSNSLIYAYANKQFRLAMSNFIALLRGLRCHVNFGFGRS